MTTETLYDEMLELLKDQEEVPVVFRFGGFWHAETRRAGSNKPIHQARGDVDLDRAIMNLLDTLRGR